jgi:hypothetical protein
VINSSLVSDGVVHVCEILPCPIPPAPKIRLSFGISGGFIIQSDSLKFFSRPLAVNRVERKGRLRGVRGLYGSHFVEKG